MLVHSVGRGFGCDGHKIVACLRKLCPRVNCYWLSTKSCIPYKEGWEAIEGHGGDAAGRPKASSYMMFSS